MLNLSHSLDTGIAEMLAMEMKREGIFVSRLLSFSDARFYNIEHNLTDQQKLEYNMAAHIWSVFLPVHLNPV